MALGPGEQFLEKALNLIKLKWLGRLARKLMYCLSPYILSSDAGNSLNMYRGSQSMTLRKRLDKLTTRLL